MLEIMSHINSFCPWVFYFQLGRMLFLVASCFLDSCLFRLYSSVGFFFPSVFLPWWNSCFFYWYATILGWRYCNNSIFCGLLLSLLFRELLFLLYFSIEFFLFSFSKYSPFFFVVSHAMVWCGLRCNSIVVSWELPPPIFYGLCFFLDFSWIYFWSTCILNFNFPKLPDTVFGLFCPIIS